MKRLILPLLWFFAATGFVAAQAELASFVDRGRATWDAATGGSGMWVAHPSLPRGSRPTIRNIATGVEVEVVVTGAIPASPDRVIDISADVARTIGLGPDGSVLVYFPSLANDLASRPYANVNLAENTISISAPNGMNIMVRNHVSAPQGATTTIHNHLIPQSVLAEMLGAFRLVPVQPQPNIRVTPGWPYSGSGRIYNLQVGGVWENADAAFDAFRRLRDGGFSDLRLNEAQGRLYILGISSFDVHSVIWRLDGMGFEEVDIREAS